LNSSENKIRKAATIGTAFVSMFVIFMVWAIFFPSQGYLKFTSKSVKSQTFEYGKSLNDGILISEQIAMGQYFISRISFLQDAGTMHVYYFNKPNSIRSISRNMVWTTNSYGASFVLPILKKEPLIQDVIASCGLEARDVKIDSLGYLQIMCEDCHTSLCDSGYGAETVPYLTTKNFIMAQKRYGSYLKSKQ